MISLSSQGSFRKTIDFLNAFDHIMKFKHFDRYGRMGVDALSKATPIETGETAHSWEYEVIKGRETTSIIWSNTHVEEGVNVAVILQYGHGTGTGGWVEGVDYINPAIQPLFEKMVDDIWREVKRG